MKQILARIFGKFKSEKTASDKIIDSSWLVNYVTATKKKHEKTGRFIALNLLLFSLITSNMDETEAKFLLETLYNSLEQNKDGEKIWIDLEVNHKTLKAIQRAYNFLANNLQDQQINKILQAIYRALNTFQVQPAVWNCIKTTFLEPYE